jgi:hypothetical protein
MIVATTVTCMSSVTAPEASLPPGSRSAAFIAIVFIEFSKRKSFWRMPSEAHAGKVRTGVLASIAVEQQVGIVHSAHLACPLSWRTLVHATKTTGNNTSRWIRILADVANVTSQLGPVSGHFREGQLPQAIYMMLEERDIPWIESKRANTAGPICRIFGLRAK